MRRGRKGVGLDGIEGEREATVGDRGDETSPKSGRRGAGVEAGGGCARTWYSARNAATFFSRSARIWRRSCSKRMSFLSNWVAIRSWRLRRGRSRGGGSRSSDVSRRLPDAPAADISGVARSCERGGARRTCRTPPPPARGRPSPRFAPRARRRRPAANGEGRVERSVRSPRRRAAWARIVPNVVPPVRNGTERRARTPVVRLLAL